MWYREYLRYVLHNDHGFGIVCSDGRKEPSVMVFYEDGAYLPELTLRTAH